MSYRVVDLGPVTGEGIKVLSVNRYGEAAGAAVRLHAPPHAAVWSVGTGGVQRRLLPVPAVWMTSGATDINDAGVVVGYVVGSDFSERPALWRADGFHLLARHKGSAFDINNAGETVGEIEIKGHDHAVVWHRNGTMTDLTARLGAPNSVATGINDAGQITGFTIPRQFHFRGFLITGQKIIQFARIHNANITLPWAINDHGRVVGHWECNLEPPTCRDSDTAGAAFSYSNGQIHNLPTLERIPDANAFAVNDAGQIVGQDTDETLDDPFLAVIWHNGTETRLDNLVTTTSFTQLTSAEDISQSGYIVGQATSTDGHFHGYMLIPTS